MSCTVDSTCCSSSPEAPEAAEKSPYTPRFWLAFASNVLGSLGFVLLYRYADLVTFLGGSEFELGWIVGIGMVGSLVVRLFMGSAIDEYGTGVVWLVSLLISALCCVAHPFLTTCHGPAIYILRIVFSAAMSGVYGAMTTWATLNAPPKRVAELVGMLGASGFLSFILGTYMGDWLMDAAVITHSDVARLFYVAGGFILVSAVFAWAATATGKSRCREPRTPLLVLVRRHNPGVFLFAAVVTGIGLGLPASFLKTFCDSIGIRQMAEFFTAYAVTALIVRLCTRRLPERTGLTPLVIAGLAILAASQLAFLAVDTRWKLIFPGILYGLSHAILFPPVLAGVTRVYPRTSSGVAVMIVLMFYDAGVLIGSPLAGVTIRVSKILGLPPYPVLFAAMCGLLVVSTGIFAAFRYRTLRRIAPAAPHFSSLAQPVATESLVVEAGPVAGLPETILPVNAPSESQTG